MKKLIVVLILLSFAVVTNAQPAVSPPLPVAAKAVKKSSVKISPGVISPMAKAVQAQRACENNLAIAQKVAAQPPPPPAFLDTTLGKAALVLAAGLLGYGTAKYIQANQ